jgi:hypothetical protein
MRVIPMPSCRSLGDRFGQSGASARAWFGSGDGPRGVLWTVPVSWAGRGACGPSGAAVSWPPMASGEFDPHGPSDLPGECSIPVHLPPPYEIENDTVAIIISQPRFDTRPGLRRAMLRSSAIVPVRQAEICPRVTRRNGRRWPTAG